MKALWLKYFLSLFLLMFAFYGQALDANFYASHSILSEGKWVKIKIDKKGIYQLTDSDIKNMGFSNLENVRVYGYGGKVLPEMLNASNIDDLNQVPTLLTAGKMIFYAEGMDSLTYNKSKKLLDREINPYSTHGYYFLTDRNDIPALNVSKQTNQASGYNEITSFTDYYLHEQELASYGDTGRQLLGEDMMLTPERTFKVPTPGLVDGTVYARFSFAALSNASTYVSVTCNDNPIKLSSSIIDRNFDLYYYYNTATPTASFDTSGAEQNIKIKYTYSGQVNNARLDYFIFTYNRKLQLYDNQTVMFFPNASIADKYVLADAPAALQVWNIDNELMPTALDITFEDNKAIFNNSINVSQNFVAFDPNASLQTPEYVCDVNNQDLHGVSVPDYVIIAPQIYIEQAERLAQIHRDNSNLDVLVVRDSDIFNEFSSGKPDATAYRKFMKMLWDRDNTKIKYLLLFGRGYFDNRQLTLDTKDDNLLLTFQSKLSYRELSSYTTDDYFGFLLDSGSSFASESAQLCLGVGRLPIKDVSEAINVVDKIEYHITHPNYGAWRSNITTIADDGNEDLHLWSAESINDILSSTYNDIYVNNKLYLREFQKESDISCKSLRNALEKNLQQGQLICTYVGHGSGMYLGVEHLWSLSDVNNVTYTNLPFFVMSACDISRIDSSVRGLGEIMLIKKDGGAVALFSTTRTVLASYNEQMTCSLFENIFKTDEAGNALRLGDIVKLAKQKFTNQIAINKLNFCLLGDPALSLGYPENKVEVTAINGEIDNQVVYPQTEMTVVGNIKHRNGTEYNDFSGTITATLYDSELVRKSDNPRNSDNPNLIYTEYPDVLSTAQAEVKNGKYEIKVIVPQDCRASDTKARLSLYAVSADGKQAIGDNRTFTIAEYDETKITIEDNIPPVISSMYLDNSDFKEGDLVNNDVTLYATFSDNMGLSANTTAIGQTLMLSLDGSTNYSMASSTLERNADNLSGKIKFPISALSAGTHKLILRVSDIMGNTTERSISFTVKAIEAEAELFVAEDPVRDIATFTATHTFTGSPEITIYVRDATGEIVFASTSTDMPVTWNLKYNGKRVPAGVYEYLGVVKSDSEFGCTSVKQMIVLDTNEE